MDIDKLHTEIGLLKKENEALKLKLRIVSRCYVKDIDKFYESTGYCDATNRLGIYKENRLGLDFKNPSSMIKDFVKWRRNNC